MLIRALNLPLAIALITLTLCAGCPGRVEQQPADTAQPTAAPKPLRMIVIDDRSLASAIDRQWHARSKAPLDIIQWSSRQLREAIKDPSALSADAVVYPTSMMSELIHAELISQLPDFVRSESFVGGDYAEHDLFPLIRHTAMRWGEQTFAVSLGHPVMVLGYRPDILEYVGAEPPKTWDELGELVNRIGSHDFSQNESLKPKYVLAQPLSANWAGETLLARAVSSAVNRARFSTLFDLRSMDAMIGTQAFLTSLQSMIDEQREGTDDAFNWGPCDSMSALHDGECALAIGWPCSSPSNSDSKTEPNQRFPIRMMALPGSKRVFSIADNNWQEFDGTGVQHVAYFPAVGRCGSVLKRTRRQRAAWGLLVRLSGREWGSTCCSASQSSTIFRQSQLRSIGRWVADSWQSEARSSYATAVEETLSRSLAMSAPRLLFSRDYRKSLNKAVHLAAQGKAQPAGALKSVAVAWDEITAAVGKSQQSDSYHRSLGLEP